MSVNYISIKLEREKPGKHGSFEGIKLNGKNFPEETKEVHILHKEFNTSALNMFKEPKETMNKDLKRIKKTVHEKKNKPDTIKWNQKEILKLKNTITELKNSLERFNSELQQVEEKIR